MSMSMVTRERCHAGQGSAYTAIVIATLVALVLCIGVMAVWFHFQDKVIVVNRTSASAHVAASVLEEKWDFKLKPGRSRMLLVKAGSDSSMRLDIKYADGVTTTMWCGYFPSWGYKYTCELYK